MNFESSATLSSIFSDKILLSQVREIVATAKHPAIAAHVGLKGELEAYLDPNASSFQTRVSSKVKKARKGSGLERMGDGPERMTTGAGLEAIVLLISRPSLLVQKGTFFLPNAPSETIPAQTIAEIKAIDRKKADAAIAINARIELIDVPRVPYVGTGWVVEKRSKSRALVVTNRHVAIEFARPDDRGGYPFLMAPNFREYGVMVDFNEEHGATEPREARVLRVVYIAGPREPDMALLEVEGPAIEKLEPLEFAAAPPKQGDKIGVIGYPAFDSRNDPAAIAKYFGDLFGVKRYAFGDISGVSTQFPEFMHDATTLGGNSGSCVYDRTTGKIVGLHFAGEFKRGNYAVTGDHVQRALRGLESTVVADPRRNGEEARGDGRNTVAHYKGRDGYDDAFLGKGKKRVEMPGFGAWKADIAEVTDADSGRATNVLKYRHFSVAMSESRKLPLITAVNIDGSKSKRLGRADKWFIDGRLGDEFQVDNAAYVRNPLDRGHMVRREDPVWGPLDVAQEANDDTFHYTNCAPQHEALNQRDWLALEDYVLGNARTRKLMVSVFTGPIMKDKDPLYRDLVRLPRAFWKIAAIVNDDTGKLSITGYILTQGELIRDVTESFAYGGFRTYQVPLKLIQDQAGIDLSHLLEHDPLAAQRREEGIETSTVGLFRPVERSGDLVL